MNADLPPAPDVSDLDPARLALFLDFDGTLVEIAQSPGEVVIPSRLRPTLARLEERLGGALAIVSGRDLADLDALLHPLELASAGNHGAAVRHAAGGHVIRAAGPPDLESLVARIKAFCDAHEGLICEPKSSGVGVHYRGRPDLEALCVSFVTALAAEQPGVETLAGKMVIEIKSADVDKGMAVALLMAGPPFAGRRPVFAGDDTTDEAAFAEVNRGNGLSIKVGKGDTVAKHRMADIGELAGWLSELAHVGERDARHGVA